ncbi:MAG: hypothetical protein UT24_C0019G0007 [Candidatus Woesebacteria bacterium GW2011_GWB1_39_12]|uniref:Uncharacterized protein n=1 Tax=Candidatus Woesebacteria bacterium GW2011_GWB1_39_12 TaxID=1618574 RepID=A0A0G0M9P2_9BACT|nr:MAG: hypothetical protein UT24_C0019G0007 [Candidatus Woesebacteria bacterium GW2011_GWB1_39_12]
MEIDSESVLDYRNYDSLLTNRQRRMSNNQGCCYCLCDRSRVIKWRRCPICGRRNGDKRYKRNAKVKT